MLSFLIKYRWYFKSIFNFLYIIKIYGLSCGAFFWIVMNNSLEYSKIAELHYHFELWLVNVLETHNNLFVWVFHHRFEQIHMLKCA